MPVPQTLHSDEAHVPQGTRVPVRAFPVVFDSVPAGTDEDARVVRRPLGCVLTKEVALHRHGIDLYPTREYIHIRLMP